MSYSFLNVRATSREVQPDRVPTCLVPPRRVPAPLPRPSVFSFRPPRPRRGRIRALRPRRPSRRARRTRLSVRNAFPNTTPLPGAGAESRSGCDDPIADGAPFDLWELARSWTPASARVGGKRTCAKKECAPDTMVPALTLHGLWPSFSTPIAAPRRVVPADARAPPPRRASRSVSGAPFERLSNLSNQNRKACFWPQDCGVPAWMRAETEPPPWRYDASLLPRGRGEPEAGARLVRRRAGRARVAEARDVRFVDGQRRDSQGAGPGGVLPRHLRPRQV